MPSSLRPFLVVSADWSANWEGRWAIEAVRTGTGYRISHPEPVGVPEAVIPALLERLPEGESCLLGLDFPVGLPHRYASYLGIRAFRDWLAGLSVDFWNRFSKVCDRPSVAQPFGPAHSAAPLRRAQLAGLLGLTEEGIYRRCELELTTRPQSLFFTCGANQVGRAALDGWQRVIRPNLPRIKLWPFDGPLEVLLAEPGIVLAEIYPALARDLLRVPKRALDSQGHPVSGRNQSAYRLAPEVQGRLQEGLRTAEARLSSSASEWCRRGFAASHDFDAFVGLVAMLSTLARCEDGGLAGSNPGGFVRSREGWIFGLQPRGDAASATHFSKSLEEEVCCSAIGFIAAELAALPSYIARPDATKRREQAVDRSFSVAAHRFVLEHTRLEAYQGRIQDSVIGNRLQPALRAHLKNESLPAGRFDLVLPRSIPVTQRWLPEAAESLAAWIRETAPSLEPGRPGVAPKHFQREEPPGLGFEVTLYRWAGGRFELRLSAFAPDDEDALIESLRAAVAKKLPKLEKARAEQQGTSVLVLEYRDVALISEFSIVAGLRRVLDETELPQPDEVLLFDADTWEIWRPRHNAARPAPWNLQIETVAIALQRPDHDCFQPLLPLGLPCARWLPPGASAKLDTHGAASCGFAEPVG